MSSLHTDPIIHITKNIDPGTSKFHFSGPGPSISIGTNSSTSYIYSTPPEALVSLDTSNDLDYHTQRISEGAPYPNFPGPGGTAAGFIEIGPGESAPMHRTQTLDYLFIIVGEVELSTSSGEKKVLKAGDVVVQRGAWHSWRNLSKEEKVRIAGVAVGCAGAKEENMDFAEEKV